MFLKPLAFAGVLVAWGAICSGLTLVVVDDPMAGAALLIGGAALGGVLMLFASAGPDATRSVRGHDVRARGGGPVQARSRPRQGPRAQYTPIDPDLDLVSDEDERTLAKPFVPDFTAHAPIGLAEIYEELDNPKVYGYLLVVAGPDRARSAPIGLRAMTVGRGSHNTLQLTDSGASVTQAALVVENGTVTLKDANSRNGTFVNNLRVTEHKLENCDVIAFGSTKILATLAG